MTKRKLDDIVSKLGLDYFKKDRSIDLTKVKRLMDKADGSLISTYLHKGSIRLKSKGSLTSTQAIDANDYLNHMDQIHLWKLLSHFLHIMKDYTVNLEWCSPDNRIVLAYDIPHLKILNIRHNITGEYLDIWNSIDWKYEPIMKLYRVNSFIPDNIPEFINSIPDMEESIEGYVAELEDGTFFKIKTKGYLALHHSKDSINSNRRLYETVLENKSDDLKDLFIDDELSINKIEEMEIFVEQLLNHTVNQVELCYNKYKDLDRKGYAINCRNELTAIEFGMAMNLYIGREFSYKEIIKSKWKEFGITDKIEEVLE